MFNSRFSCKVANDIGYPVMIKASAGGGGKGMRIAWNDKEARFPSKRRSLHLEMIVCSLRKFIDNPRHIEMQVLCDKHGNAIWLNERECSIQRRNQKVIEEAPSSFVIPEMRRKMGEQACQLALAVGYDSAGTVEFLVDSKRNFYFLEMNTRLQVEHPITECITGIDIVQQMLRVAYGHKLPLTQDQVPLNGWAFESRVYAEDPYKGFGLPSIGRLSKYVEPRHIAGVRCDSGIREGSEISIYYDPLICKLVTHGADRQQALERMVEALDNYVIRGVTNNIPLLRDICQEERFRSGNITTKYLPETYPEGFQGATLNEDEEETIIGVASALNARKLARANMYLNHERQTSTSVDPYTKHYRFTVQLPSLNGEQRKIHNVEVYFENADQNKARVLVDKRKISVDGDLNLAHPVIHLSTGAKAKIATQIVGKRAGEITILFKGSPFKIKVLPEQALEFLKYMKEKPKVSKLHNFLQQLCLIFALFLLLKLDLSTVVLAPMPGAIKSVSAKVGDMVSEGQELVVMEAMKMQNSLHAGKTGKVKTVNVKVGDTVDEAQVLVELE
ncbi:Carbamoyl-phosphate synthase L chain, ATP binding domain protein [Ostertagia ostertagi]